MEYRSLCPHALIGLALGLLSVLALLGPLAWVLPAAAIPASLLALRRIASDEQALAGRALARAGLVLGLVFAVAGPTNWLLYRHVLEREAQRFARPWFQLLGEGQVHKAFLLTIEPQSRLPLDVSLPELCRRADLLCKELEEYRKQPLVQELAALGDRATIRFDRVLDQQAGSDRDYVRLLYSLSFDDGTGRHTQRIALNLERVRLRVAAGWHLGRADWRILKAEKTS